VIQAAIILVVVALISGAGFVSGKKWERSVWQPVYHQLATQLTKLQSDLNIKNAEAIGVANVALAEITVYGKVSEVKNESMQKEIDRRVDDYLNQLSLTRMQLPSKEGDSGKGINSGSLPNAARVSIERGGEGGLFKDLDRFEREALNQIIRKAEKATALNKNYRDYLNKTEAKMKTLR
jgi:uncharacterized protein YdgA (DUF945 family)|tara:strand:- start:1 stop:537 length:537 start_codon:yes stop_codon:yes gene_type:complete